MFLNITTGNYFKLPVVFKRFSINSDLRKNLFHSGEGTNSFVHRFHKCKCIIVLFKNIPELHHLTFVYYADDDGTVGIAVRPFCGYSRRAVVQLCKDFGIDFVGMGGNNKKFIRRF